MSAEMVTSLYEDLKTLATEVKLLTQTINSNMVEVLPRLTSIEKTYEMHVKLDAQHSEHLDFKLRGISENLSLLAKELGKEVAPLQAKVKQLEAKVEEHDKWGEQVRGIRWFIIIVVGIVGLIPVALQLLNFAQHRP